MISSIDFSPNGHTTDVNSGQKRRSILCIPGGNAAPLLQSQKCIFNKMPQLVKVLVIFTLDLAVALRRNDYRHAGQYGQLDKRINIIALVCQKVLGINTIDQPCSLRAISSGTFCNKHSDRHTMRIHGQVYLGVEPPFVRPMA